MGTTWSVRAFAPHGFATERFHADVEAAFTAIIDQMSSWAPHSLLSQFNALPGGGLITAPPDFAEVLTCGLNVAAKSGGAFDPTIGRLVDLWGFGARALMREAPDAIELALARSAAGWDKLAFDAEARVLRQPGGLALDFSGIAKGYAVDRVAALAEQAGLASYLIEIGGELRGRGVKPDGQPWWVEVERAPSSPAATMLVALYDLAIATSGDYRRNAIVAGQSIAHTIDPRTGQPLRNTLTAVTVLHASCMHADAWATALMVLGAEGGLARAAEMGLAAMFVERDGAERFSPRFARMLA